MRATRSTTRHGSSSSRWSMRARTTSASRRRTSSRAPPSSPAGGTKSHGGAMRCSAARSSPSSRRALPVLQRRLHALVRLGQAAPDTEAACRDLLAVAEREGTRADVVQIRSLLVQACNPHRSSSPQLRAACSSYSLLNSISMMSSTSSPTKGGTDPFTPKSLRLIVVLPVIATVGRSTAPPMPAASSSASILIGFVTPCRVRAPSTMPWVASSS